MKYENYIQNYHTCKTVTKQLKRIKIILCVKLLTKQLKLSCV